MSEGYAPLALTRYWIKLTEIRHSDRGDVQSILHRLNLADIALLPQMSSIVHI